MVNKVDLDKLLDNDHLTPAQKRQLRRFLKYEIFLMGGKVTVAFRPKHDTFAGESLAVLPKNKDKHLLVYKRIMENLISTVAYDKPFQGIGEQVQELILNDQWQKIKECKKRPTQLYFKEDHTVQMPDATEITAQTLFAISKALLKF